MTNTEHPDADGAKTGFEFDRAVAVSCMDGGGYAGHLDGAWSIGAGNGGLLLAACANALCDGFAADGHPDPFSFSISTDYPFAGEGKAHRH